MSRDWRRLSLGCLLVAFAFLLIGCGSGNSEAGDSLGAIDFGDATFASCLKSSGAHFAQSSDDLDFFSVAQDEDAASKFGFSYDRSAELFVELWEDGDDPREWLMWSAQPFDEDMSPDEIVSSGSSGSYVAYMLKPSSRERQAAKDCTLKSQERRTVQRG
jgi:hypothetical protein